MSKENFSHTASIILMLLTPVILAGCIRTPRGISVVDDFNVTRYLGKWYEIARLDHRFERGLTNVTAEYSMADDGSITVVNRGYNPEKKKWSEIEGHAYLASSSEVGQLKVSFFWPFYGAYNIIELDKDYAYAMVSGSSRSYLWILARTPTIDPEIKSSLLAKAQELGFKTEELIFVEHD